nr:unnamed protein product [Digitaria exilis]
MEIAKGIARGLICLHDDMRIMHGHLTVMNVLLDTHFHPKLADFGLFHLLTPAANSDVLTAACESGYHAPELSSTMNYSTKTDVYSLGIIILELVTGKTPSNMDLPSFVRSREEWWSDIIDQELMLDKDAGPSLDQLEATLKLALECVDPSPSARPQAWEVLWKLAKICLPGPKNAAKPSEDRSPSLDLEARDDDAGAGQSEDDDLSLRIEQSHQAK